jgi:hypothetical protein
MIADCVVSIEQVVLVVLTALVGVLVVVWAQVKPRAARPTMICVKCMFV